MNFQHRENMRTREPKTQLTTRDGEGEKKTTEEWNSLDARFETSLETDGSG